MRERERERERRQEREKETQIQMDECSNDFMQAAQGGASFYKIMAQV